MHSDQRERFARLLDASTHACAWGYARSLTGQSGGCRADAEDLLQDALTQAWRGLAGLRDESRFRAWLLAIIRRRFLTRRSRARPVQPLEHAADELAAPDDNPRLRELLDALAGLPDGPRELLSLFYLHGLCAAEVAQVVGTSASVVNMRLARARERLRQALGQAAERAAADSSVAERGAQ